MVSEVKYFSIIESGKTRYFEILHIRGYLFKNHHLIGIYVEDFLIWIDPEKLPEWVHKRLLTKQKCVLKLEFEEGLLYGYLVDLESQEDWLVFEKEVVGPGGFEPPTTRL